jgi:PilZ domain-containing protein
MATLARKPVETPDAAGPAERRREARVELGVRAAVRVDGSWRLYRVCDVSCAGAQLARASNEPPPPPVHTLVIDLGAGTPVRVLARTVWSKPGRHAVSFLAMNDLDRLTIAEGLDRCIRRAAVDDDEAVSGVHERPQPE